MDLYGPDPDFAGLARSMGWYAEGPVENGDDLKARLSAPSSKSNKVNQPWLTPSVTDEITANCSNNASRRSRREAILLTNRLVQFRNLGSYFHCQQTRKTQIQVSIAHDMSLLKEVQKELGF